MLRKIALAAEKKKGEKKVLKSMVQVSRFEEQTLRLEKKLEIEKDGNRQEKEWNEQMWEVKAIEINLNVRCQ